MSNLTHLFKIGEKVVYRNIDFDSINKNMECIVKEVFKDHIIITDIATNTDMWVEEGLNINCVYKKYTFM